eukprot:470133_1
MLQSQQIPTPAPQIQTSTQQIASPIASTIASPRSTTYLHLSQDEKRHIIQQTIKTRNGGMNINVRDGPRNITVMRGMLGTDKWAKDNPFIDNIDYHKTCVRTEYGNFLYVKMDYIRPPPEAETKTEEWDYLGHELDDIEDEYGYHADDGYGSDCVHFDYENEDLYDSSDDEYADFHEKMNNINQYQLSVDDYVLYLQVQYESQNKSFEYLFEMADKLLAANVSHHDKEARLCKDWALWLLHLLIIMVIPMVTMCGFGRRPLWEQSTPSQEETRSEFNATCEATSTQNAVNRVRTYPSNIRQSVGQLPLQLQAVLIQKPHKQDPPPQVLHPSALCDENYPGNGDDTLFQNKQCTPPQTLHPSVLRRDIYGEDGDDAFALFNDIYGANDGDTMHQDDACILGNIHARICLHASALCDENYPGNRDDTLYQNKQCIHRVILSEDTPPQTVHPSVLRSDIYGDDGDHPSVLRRDIYGEDGDDGICFISFALFNDIYGANVQLSQYFYWLLGYYIHQFYQYLGLGYIVLCARICHLIQAMIWYHILMSYSTIIAKAELTILLVLV